MIAPTGPVWDAVNAGKYKARHHVEVSTRDAGGYIDVTDRVVFDGIGPIERMLGPGLSGSIDPRSAVSLRNDDDYLTPGRAGSIWGSATEAYMTPFRIRTAIQGADGAWQKFPVFSGVVDAVNTTIDQVEVLATSRLGWLDRAETSEEYDVAPLGSGQYATELATHIGAVIDADTPFLSTNILEASPPQVDWLKFNGWALEGIVGPGERVGPAVRDLARSYMMTAHDTESGDIALRSEVLPRSLGGTVTGYPWGGDYVPVTFDSSNSLVVETDAIQSMATSVTVKYLGGTARYVDEDLEAELATAFGLPAYRVSRTVDMPYVTKHWQAAWAARVIQESVKVPKYLQIQTHVGLGVVVQLNDRIRAQAATATAPVTARVVGKQWEPDGTMSIAALVNPAETSVFEADIAEVGDSWATGTGAI